MVAHQHGDRRIRAKLLQPVEEQVGSIHIVFKTAVAFLGVGRCVVRCQEERGAIEMVAKHYNLANVSGDRLYVCKECLRGIGIHQVAMCVWHNQAEEQRFLFQTRRLLLRGQRELRRTTLPQCIFESLALFL